MLPYKKINLDLYFFSMQLTVLILCGKLIQEIKAIKADYEQYYNDTGAWPAENLNT